MTRSTVDLANEIEAYTPGWHWLCYRTWRARGEYSLTARPSMEMTSYQVTGRRRWRGRPDAEQLVGAGGDAVKAWIWSTFTIDVGECHLIDGQGRRRASIWKQRFSDEYIWHTWDKRGAGGENSAAATLNTAKDEAIAAIVRQGWAPGGWKVSW